jgi:MOSC domain-containing protein YiiM
VAIFIFLSFKKKSPKVTYKMDFKQLHDQFTQPGKVKIITFRTKRLEPVKFTDEILAIKDKGLEGDRYKNPGGDRQVTFIQVEHLKAIASYLGKEEVNPGLTRRNIVVQGINLLALKGKRFKVGEAVMEYSGECHPCSRMEESLGHGGYNAMRGHGGITAKVIEGGLIREGDDIYPI